MTIVPQRPRLPLTGPPVRRGVLLRVCELLGLEPRSVRTITMHPGEVEVELYCSRADGTRYLDPQSLRWPDYQRSGGRVATFVQHHPVVDLPELVEQPAVPARPSGPTPRSWEPNAMPTPEQRAEWLARCSDAELLQHARQVEVMQSMLDHDTWLRRTLHEVLGMFHERGHPGRPCRRTGWVPVERLDLWRDRLAR